MTRMLPAARLGIVGGADGEPARAADVIALS